MASGNATVKAVLSGDTIVLVGKATNGPPPEITLTLNDIQAPKVARGPQQTDEAFAWKSREFLRKLCIGKSVTFRVTQMVPAINRTFGDAILNGENLSKTVIAAGWAQLKEQKDSTDEALAGQMSAAYQEAKAEKRGMHCESELLRKGSIRPVNWSLDAESFFNGLTSSATTAGRGSVVRRDSPIATVIFEHIRDGATFRCFVPSVCGYVSIALAGAVCPRVNAKASSSVDVASAETAGASTGAVPGTGGEGGPEPFALQGKLFTELRVLNRELDVAIHASSAKSGTDGTLLVTILHPKGNITVELVKAGLARVADWTLALLPRQEVIAVRQAENEAKAARRGVWADYTPPEPSPDCRTFEGRVVEVVTGDTIIVAENVDGDNYVERRVSFSSVRVPRLGSNGKNSSTRPESFAAECKEFVRSHLIGQSVFVSVEYSRKSDTGYRLYASVYFGKASRREGIARPNQNMGQLLVSQGLAFTVKHRGDEPRAAAYDMMLVDEAEAMLAKRGVHSGKEPGASVTAGGVNDVSSDGKKAKAIFNIFQKDRIYRGMVDHVFTGSRFKITLPSENVCLQLALSQVRCHNIPRKDAEATAEVEDTGAGGVAIWAEAAKRYSRLNVLQRQVDVEITDVDRNGVMLGKLYVVDGESKQNRRAAAYAHTLVQNGLAWVDRYALVRGGSEIETLSNAQELCQTNGVGLWSSPHAVPVDPSASNAADAAQDDEALGSACDQLIIVKVSEIYDGSNFCVNIATSSTSETTPASTKFAEYQKLGEIEQLMSSAFASDEETSEVALPSLRPGGTLVACGHDEGEGVVWMRAKVEEIDGDSVKVFFVDYGHRATVPKSNLKGLAEEIAAFPSQALDCCLAIAKAPPLQSEYGVTAARALNSLVWDMNCAMRIVSGPSSSEQGGGRGKLHFVKSSSKYEVVLYALPTLTDVTTQQEQSVDDYVNVNTWMVKNGLARISATAAKIIRRKGTRKGTTDTFSTELLESLQEAQEIAHREHLRIWTYGHPGDSDDEDEDRRKPAATVGGKV